MSDETVPARIQDVLPLKTDSATVTQGPGSPGQPGDCGEQFSPTPGPTPEPPRKVGLVSGGLQGHPDGLDFGENSGIEGPSSGSGKNNRQSSTFVESKRSSCDARISESECRIQGYSGSGPKTPVKDQGLGVTFQNDEDVGTLSEETEHEETCCAETKSSNFANGKSPQCRFVAKSESLNHAKGISNSLHCFKSKQSCSGKNAPNEPQCTKGKCKHTPPDCAKGKSLCGNGKSPDFCNGRQNEGRSPVDSRQEFQSSRRLSAIEKGKKGGSEKSTEESRNLEEAEQSATLERSPRLEPGGRLLTRNSRLEEPAHELVRVSQNSFLFAAEGQILRQALEFGDRNSCENSGQLNCKGKGKAGRRRLEDSMIIGPSDPIMSEFSGSPSEVQRNALNMKDSAKIGDHCLQKKQEKGFSRTAENYRGGNAIDCGTEDSAKVDGMVTERPVVVGGSGRIPAKCSEAESGEKTDDRLDRQGRKMADPVSSSPLGRNVKSGGSSLPKKIATSPAKKHRPSPIKDPIRIRTRDGTTFYACRSLLANESEYFEQLFDNIVSASEFSLPGIPSEAFRQALLFLNTGILPLSADMLTLLRISEQLAVSRLGEACAERVVRENLITKETCLNFLAVCCRNGRDCFPQLRSHAMCLVIRHFKELVIEDDVGREMLLQLSFHALGDILDSEWLDVGNREDIVWEIGLEWVMYDVSRRHYLVRILNFVRLGMLDRSYYIDKIKRNPLVFQDPNCVAYLNVTARAKRATARIPHQVLLVIGGRQSNGMAVKEIEVFDPIFGRWDVVSDSNLPFESAAGYVSIGCEIYAVGVQEEADASGDGCACYVYHPMRNWSRIQNLHRDRRGAIVTALNGRVAVFHGLSETTKTNFEVYNKEKNCWELNTFCVEKRSCKPWIHSVAPTFYSLTTTVDNSLYLYMPKAGWVFFCKSSNTWQRFIAPRIPKQVDPCRLVSFDSSHSICCLGPTDGVFFHTRTDQMERVQPRACPRYHFGAAVLEDSVYVIGGQREIGGDILRSVIKYSPSKGWREVLPLTFPRSLATVCVVTYREAGPMMKLLLSSLDRDQLLQEKTSSLLASCSPCGFPELPIHVDTAGDAIPRASSLTPPSD